jgi:transcription elongation GreA/GreB family factor
MCAGGCATGWASGAGAECSPARMAVPSAARHAVAMSMQAATTTLDAALRRARRAGLGSTVEVVDRAGRTTVYEIVAQRPGPAPRPVTLDSAEGLALLGVRPGDAVTIPAENGRHRRVSVVDVTPAGRAREGDPPPA